MPVLLAAGDGSWERMALAQLAAAEREVVLLKRCLDVADLVGAASTGTARVAVVSARLAGLDADCARRLADHGVAVVAVLDPGGTREATAAAERSRLLRLGARSVLTADRVESVVAAVRAAAEPVLSPAPAPGGPDPGTADAGEPADAAPEGTVIAVWGAAGAPGRTTVSLALAALAAQSGRRVTLLDADPAGGTAAQHLAVVEDVSGLLSATRLANAGQLDRHRLAAAARAVAPGLRLLTGLPRPDRWPEVRPAALTEVVEVARTLDELVLVDAGAGLPAAAYDGLGGPTREELTRTVLEVADQVLVVAGADPVGLTRLVRALRELRDQCGPERTVHVVVNRMRGSLGWQEAEVSGLVHRVDPRLPVAFLPDDRVAADRALLAGRPLGEGGPAGLRTALVALSEQLLGAPAEAAAVRRPRRVRRRR